MAASQLSVVIWFLVLVVDILYVFLILWQNPGSVIGVFLE